MEVTRDVIQDLIPVYLEGGASPATRALVEDWLARDPELAASVRASADAGLPLPPAPAPPPDLELRAVARTRSVLFRMRWLFALAWAFTVVGSSTELAFTAGHLSGAHLALAGHPILLAGCLGLGVACWIGYFRLRRRLSFRVR